MAHADADLQRPDVVGVRVEVEVRVGHHQAARRSAGRRRSQTLEHIHLVGRGRRGELVIDGREWKKSATSASHTADYVEYNYYSIQLTSDESKGALAVTNFRAKTIILMPRINVKPFPLNPSESDMTNSSTVCLTPIPHTCPPGVSACVW